MYHLITAKKKKKKEPKEGRFSWAKKVGTLSRRRRRRIKWHLWNGLTFLFPIYSLWSQLFGANFPKHLFLFGKEKKRKEAFESILSWQSSESWEVIRTYPLSLSFFLFLSAMDISMKRRTLLKVIVLGDSGYVLLFFLCSFFCVIHFLVVFVCVCVRVFFFFFWSIV